MRQNKWLVQGTLFITIISVLIAYAIGKTSNSIMYDISMAIFGSAFLGFIMSLIQYFSERRHAMECFWKEATNTLSKLKTIPYINVDAPLELIVKCLVEEEANEWEELLNPESSELKKSIVHEAKNELILWYGENHIQSETDCKSNAAELDKFYTLKLEEARKAIMNCIDKCIELAEYDLGALDNAYRNLDFLIHNRKIRDVAYSNVYDSIMKDFEKLKKESYHFKELKKHNCRFSVCAHKITEIHESVFSIEETKEENASYKKLVYRRKFHKIEVSLEEFRCKIYWEENDDVPELIPVFGVANIKSFEENTDKQEQ